MDREHSRQHNTVHIKVALIETDSFGISGRCLYRDMTLNVRITLRSIFQHGDIREDQGIRPQLCGHIHRPLPAAETVRMGKGINRNMQMTPVAVNIIHCLGKFLFSKIQTGEVTGISIIFQADINRICAVINGGFQCG